MSAALSSEGYAPFASLLIDDERGIYSQNGIATTRNVLSVGDSFAGCELTPDMIAFLAPWVDGVTIVVDFFVDELNPLTDDFRVEVDLYSTPLLSVHGQVVVIRTSPGPIGDSVILFAWGDYEHYSQHNYIPAVNNGGRKRMACEYRADGLMSISINGGPAVINTGATPTPIAIPASMEYLGVYWFSGGTGGGTDGATGQVLATTFFRGINYDLDRLSRL